MSAVRGAAQAALLPSNHCFTRGRSFGSARRRRSLVLLAAARCEVGAGAPAANDLLLSAAAQRRRLLLSAAGLAASAAVWQQLPAAAVQGLTAGRIPGISGPDEEGYLTYMRPEGKSGGHGVGWSEIPRYQFKVPEGWEEVPVSIADLGGTEIDLRYRNPDEGDLEVVVAPILRFRDVGFNADVSLTELGPPEKIISGFAPELYGAPISDEEMLDVQVLDKRGRPYYLYELRGHRLVTCTAVGNRVFMLAARCNSRQWRKSEAHLRTMQQSFWVAPLQRSS